MRATVLYPVFTMVLRERAANRKCQSATSPPTLQPSLPHTPASLTLHLGRQLPPPCSHCLSPACCTSLASSQRLALYSCPDLPAPSRHHLTQLRNLHGVPGLYTPHPNSPDCGLRLSDWFLPASPTSLLLSSPLFLGLCLNFLYP